MLAQVLLQSAQAVSYSLRDRGTSGFPDWQRIPCPTATRCQRHRGPKIERRVGESKAGRHSRGLPSSHVPPLFIIPPESRNTNLRPAGGLHHGVSKTQGYCKHIIHHTLSISVQTAFTAGCRSRRPKATQQRHLHTSSGGACQHQIQP